VEGRAATVPAPRKLPWYCSGLQKLFPVILDCFGANFRIV
jgi:hypothetical protein